MEKYVVYLDGFNRYVSAHNENDAIRAALDEEPPGWKGSEWPGSAGATWRVSAPSPYGGTHYDVDRPFRVTCLAYVKERKW